MPDGASQSAIDLRCKTARDPQETLHLNQTRMPWPGCCLSHNRMLAVIMPECAGGVAPPEFIKLLHYSENRAWTWPCELDSPCLSGGTCHPKRKIVSPDPRSAIPTPKGVSHALRRIEKPLPKTEDCPNGHETFANYRRVGGRCLHKNWRWDSRVRITWLSSSVMGEAPDPTATH